jgi:transcriptional regulator with XRE-family HTH domain
MNMGERLRELRLRRNISQEEVARHIGITRSAYSHYEINNRQPVYETLIKLAAYFDVSLDYMIGGTTSKHKTETSDAQDTREIMQLLRHMDQEQRKTSIRLLNELMTRQQAESGGA